MQALTIKEALTFKPGSVIPAIGGRVTAVQAIQRGEDQGGWSVQDLMIEDATGSIQVKTGNQREISKDMIGQVLYFLSHKREKGGFIGVKIDQDEYTEEGTVKQFAFVAVSRSAEIISETEYQAKHDSKTPPAQTSQTAQPATQAASTPPAETQQPGTQKVPVQDAAPSQPNPGGMRIVEIRYDKTVNTGNYCSEKVGITIQLDPGVRGSDAMEAAKLFVNKHVPKEAVSTKGRALE